MVDRRDDQPSQMLRLAGKSGWIPAHDFIVSGMTFIEVFT
jgi:hypothetical protein